MAENRDLGRGPSNITSSGSLEMVGSSTLIQERLQLTLVLTHQQLCDLDIYDDDVDISYDYVDISDDNMDINGDNVGVSDDKLNIYHYYVEIFDDHIYIYIYIYVYIYIYI